MRKATIITAAREMICINGYTAAEKLERRNYPRAASSATLDHGPDIEMDGADEDGRMSETSTPFDMYCVACAGPSIHATN